MSALTYGATTAGSAGWDATAILTTVGGALLLVAFVMVQRARVHPLVPMHLFADRTFSGTNAMTFLTYGALSAVVFVFVLHLQVSAGYGPLAAGLATVPVTAALLLLSARSGALAARIGPRRQLIGGPLLCAAGLLLLLRVDASHRAYLLDVLPGIAVFALGLAAFVAPLTATVMAAAPPDQAGIGSGINNAVSRAAGLLAVAVLPALAGLHGESYRAAPVMAHGFRLVTVYCIILLAAAALVVTATVRNPTHTAAPSGGR